MQSLIFVLALFASAAMGMPSELNKRVNCCLYYPGPKSNCKADCIDPSFCKAYGIPQTGYWCDCGPAAHCNS
ncbi:uncharacterized protein TrAtP1_005032 [Trichoderma atroviride]|uniref:uncharacterized protein n=1 Tax=Hypocrea atroviridis TaxID=63577 RepID=UPI00332FFAC7|nr:hypothetical protein TrAtP1_005032 [Trichoderma atroviride]